MKHLIENINATIMFWPNAAMWGIQYNISINRKTHLNEKILQPFILEFLRFIEIEKMVF